jgi:hypothetical protein
MFSGLRYRTTITGHSSAGRWEHLWDNYLHVEIAAKPVLNAGIGFRGELHKKLILLLGVSTDFGSYDKPSETNELLNSFRDFDVYHFSAGLS